MLVALWVDRLENSMEIQWAALKVDQTVDVKDSKRADLLAGVKVEVLVGMRAAMMEK